jgi:hypothetical protein
MRKRYRFVPAYKARRRRGFFLDLEKPSYRIRRKAREEIEKCNREIERAKALRSALAQRPSLLKRLGDWFRGA